VCPWASSDCSTLTLSREGFKPEQTRKQRRQDHNPAYTGGRVAAAGDIDANPVYTLAELIDIAQSRNRTTRVACEQARQQRTVMLPRSALIRIAAMRATYNRGPLSALSRRPNRAGQSIAVGPKAEVVIGPAFADGKRS